MLDGFLVSSSVETKQSSIKPSAAPLYPNMGQVSTPGVAPVYSYQFEVLIWIQFNRQVFVVTVRLVL